MALDSAPRAPGSASKSKPLALSRGEHTLDAFNEEAFIWRLLRSMCTLQETTVSVQRPRRCGGAMRSRRALSQSYEFTSSVDDRWDLPTPVVDSWSESRRVAQLCRRAECAKELDTTSRWWGRRSRRRMLRLVGSRRGADGPVVKPGLS